MTSVRRVEPIPGPVDADVRLPGSKSLTNRALLVAALGTGTSRLAGTLDADDTRAMLRCVEALGAVTDGALGDDPIAVRGTGGNLRRGPVTLHADLSGTTARFLGPVAAVGPGPYRIDGRDPLRARPMTPLVVALRRLGAHVVEEGEPGHLPLAVTGPPELRPGETGTLERPSVALAGDTSSQFLSGLLMVAPITAAGLDIEVVGPLVSVPYVEMTSAVMAMFGAVVERPAPHRWAVASGGYRAADVEVEPDASAASYAFAAAAICGGRVRVAGLGTASLQGDVAFVDLLERMGARVERSADAIAVTGTGTLTGIDADLADISDTAQTLAAVAVFAEGPTTVRGVGFIRGKETDRIAAVVRELRRCGIGAHERHDGFTVEPGHPRPAQIQTYDDHRMAMSFSLLGLRAPGIEIADPDCVAKTFPGFFDLLDELRASAVRRPGSV